MISDRPEMSHNGGRLDDDSTVSFSAQVGLLSRSS